MYVGILLRIRMPLIRKKLSKEIVENLAHLCSCACHVKNISVKAKSLFTNREISEKKWNNISIFYRIQPIWVIFYFFWTLYMFAWISWWERPNVGWSPKVFKIPVRRAAGRGYPYFHLYMCVARLAPPGQK